MDYWTRIGLITARSFLNERVKGFTANDVQRAIDKNQDLWSATPKDIKKKGLALRSPFLGLLKKYKNVITTNLMLQWLKEDHPGIHRQIMSSRDGYYWFHSQVEKIKACIFGE